MVLRGPFYLTSQESSDGSIKRRGTRQPPVVGCARRAVVMELWCSVGAVKCPRRSSAGKITLSVFQKVFGLKCIQLFS